MRSLKPNRKSVSYLRARLEPFKRPLFWFSLLVLGLTGFVIYQYWQHPELLEGNSDKSIETSKQDNSDTRSSLSSDDLAVGADIDNLQLLFTELEKQETLTPAASIETNTSNRDQSETDSINKFQEKQKKTSQNSKSNINSQSPNFQTNLNSDDLLLERANLRGIGPIERNSNNLPSSNSPFKANSLGRLYRSDRNFNRQQDLSTNNNYNFANFNSSFNSANIQPNNLTENSTSPAPNLQQIPQNQADFGTVAPNNFSSFNNNYTAQQSIAPLSPTGYNQNLDRFNNAYPNYSQGISNNSQQLPPLNNPYQYNGTQSQNQLRVNNTYNNPYQYGAGNYGTPSVNGTNMPNYQTTPVNPHSLNNYQNYQAQPSTGNSNNFNGSGYKPNALNQFDFNK
jgi:hypothetical protein